MDLIALLKDRVSPLVLQNHTTFLTEKSSALSAFYPFLLSALKENPKLISFFQNNLNPRIADLFGSNSGLKDQLLAHLGGPVPVEELEQTINKSIAPTLSLLGDQAGTQDEQGIVQFIQQHASSIQAALPQWSTSLLSGLGLGAVASAASNLGSSVTSKVNATTSSVQQNIPEKPKKGILWPIIGLLILVGLIALLLRACDQKKAAPDAAPAAPSAAEASTESAALHLKTDGQGQVESCEVSIADAGFVDVLQNHIKTLFTKSQPCNANTDAKFQAALLDQKALPDVLKHVQGVPNVDLSWVDNKLTIQAPDQAQAQQLADKVKSLVPNLQVVAGALQGVDVNQTVNNSIDQAKKALSDLTAGGTVGAEDIAKALNLQIINFSSASSAIPDSNKQVLDQAAALLTKAPDVKLNVKGFTDSTGKAEANKVLSQKRAQAVADYLISKGAKSDQLTAVGYGQENPVADNATKEGQFKNRRIEFEVVNTQTGEQQKVDAQH
ncbi:OmpA family protein [Acinetobacter sp. WZC-1]|uniref:OmpA family protein n=1 Tax=Acinetobacter sp. WZC-1 TaxID=3459034 RepID=UPI00403DA2BA